MLCDSIVYLHFMYRDDWLRFIFTLIIFLINHIGVYMALGFKLGLELSIMQDYMYLIYRVLIS